MWFLVMAFEDGIAVITLLIGGDEVGIDLLFGLAYLYSEGWNFLEGA